MSIFQAPKVDEVDPDARSDPRDTQFFKELDRHFHPAISFEQELEIMQQEIFSRPEATWHHFTSNGIDAGTGGPIIDESFSLQLDKDYWTSCILSMELDIF